jgi:methionine biosynthesis protein MetW
MSNQTIKLRPDLLALANLIHTHEKVLDLGCGDGSLLFYLQNEKSAKTRGVELHEKGVLACIERGVSVRQGNLHEGLDDYPDQAFDAVILSHTLPYINNPAGTLREMLRVGQRAIITFPNFGYWRYRLELLILGRMPNPPELPSPWEKGPRPRPMTIYDFEFLCAREGIPIDKTIYLYHGKKIDPRWGQNLRASSVIFVLQ